MAGQKKRGRTQSDDEKENEAQTDEVSGYEQFRDQRIKENLERMQKLGILDLSRKLKPPPPPKRSPHVKKKSSFSDPPRRSSRLENLTPVTYKEVRGPLYQEVGVPKKKNRKKSEESEEESEEEIHIKEASEPEIYTEEHQRLLGDYRTAWTLKVDGYGEDGERIYDPFNAKSCHQCRQKTVGHRTNCSKCKLVQGQFCGDCLFTSYGENILEANQNLSWICPVCRGICNCSRCRREKGWAPIVPLYRKVSKLGFKSVAHYLIQTRRSKTNQEEPAAEKLPGSPNILNSADTEAEFLNNEGLDPHICPDGTQTPQYEGKEDVQSEDKEDVQVGYSDVEYNEADDSDDGSDDDSDDESYVD